MAVPMTETVGATSQAPTVNVNPVATTPTNPTTTAPIVGQGPITSSAPLNMAMGAAVVGTSQWGMAALTGGPEVLGTSVFLNLMGQLFKGAKWFPEHKGLIILFLVVSFVIAYFVLFDREAGRAFLHMSNSTMEAILNYKGDKAAGLNIMPPVPEHKEYAT